MTCARKNALLKAYRDTVAGYIRIVKRMKKKPVMLSQADFAALSAEAKSCLAKTKAAQRLLQQHVDKHHC
jgi:hypothetical protein